MLDLLVIQATAKCNLDCSYCYVPDREDSTRVPIPLLEQLFRAVRCSNLARSQSDLRLLWHAGEPLAAGIAFYRKALDLANEMLGDTWYIRHSMQTNATLVTSEWCHLFNDWDVRVGVSVDGPQDIHDANRQTRAGRGSFSSVMRGVDLLRAHGIDVSALCVLTARSLQRPDDIFEFFVAQSLNRIAFNVEEIEGSNAQSSLLEPRSSLASTRARYRAFMSRMLELNRQHGWPLHIREFASLAARFQTRRHSPAVVPIASEQRAGAVLTMARDGCVYSWSPELASGNPDARSRLSLGNIRDVASVDEFLATEKAARIQSEIDAGINMCRRGCEYFQVCGGGSPANKFFERGTFGATETLKCTLQVQELSEVILALGARAS